MQVMQALTRTQPRRALAASVATSLGCVLAATVLLYGIELFATPMVVFSPYLVAALIAALIAGLSAGLLTAILGGAAGLLLFVLPNRAELPSGESIVLGVALYLVSSAISVALAESYRRALTRLREKEETAQATVTELETLYRDAPIGLALFSRDLRFVRVNSLLAEMNGIPATAHLGKSLHELLPDMAPTVTAKLKRVFDTGQAIIGFELRGTTPATGNQEHVWRADYYPVKRADGSVAAVCAIVSDITERVRMDEALLQAQARNEILMREIHHRVKNSLQLILSLIHIHSRSAAGELRPIFIDLQRRVYATARVYERIHTTAAMEELEVCGLLQEICSDLGAGAPEGARVQVTAGEPVVLGNDAAIAVALITNELVTNAMKHAFRDGSGSISVHCGREDGEFVVSVADDGDGLGELDLDNLHGFGIRMMRSLLQPLAGSLRALPRDRGSLIEFRIPLRKGPAIDGQNAPVRMQGSGSQGHEAHRAPH